MRRHFIAVVTVAILGLGCVQPMNENEIHCGLGTSLIGNECIAMQGNCPPGQMIVNGLCQQVGICANGTQLKNGECQPNQGGPGIACGQGTVLQGTQCIVATVHTGGALSTFLDRPNLVHGRTTGYGDHVTYRVRFVMTDLSQGNADGWAGTGNAMIGNGNALHITASSNTSFNTAGTRFFTIANTTNNSNGCSVSLDVGDEPSEEFIFVNYVAWNAGVPSGTACAKQGTVKVTTSYVSGSGYVPVFTINAAMSDGTQLIDRVVE
jgi:hypothetical protein